MRVLHVVTLVSPDGAFGGPVRVAENQVAALSARGHDVSVLAARSGWTGRAPERLGGVPLRTFPARRLLPGAGFSGLLSAGVWRQAWRALARTDVVHVHLGRDLVTLPVAAMAVARGVPLVLQPHGMVVPSGHPLARPLDALLTRRVLRGAAAVLHLTPEERQGLEAVAGPGLALHELGNGVPLGAEPTAPDADEPEVLFCARLHERKRPAAFTRTARTLLAEGVRARFVLVGPDEGQADVVRQAVRAVGDPDRLRWEGALAPDRTVARAAAADVVVLPSVDEPYPMSVLEALSVGRPVVITDTCGLAGAVRESGAGLVVDASQQALDDAVRHAVSDPAWRRQAGERAHALARDRFSMAAVTDRLEEVYRTAPA